MSYLFKHRFIQMATSQRMTEQWDGGTAGMIPRGVVVSDRDTGRIFLGDGEPESAPTTGTVGGILVGPETGGGWSTITSTSTGTQDDFNPTAWNTCQQLLLNPASTLTITGFLAPASWTPAPFLQDGQTKIVTNISANTVNILASPSTSAANNEIMMPGTFVLSPNNSVVVRYDLANTKWRLAGSTKPMKHYHTASTDGGEIAQFIEHQVRNATVLTTLKKFTRQAITIVEAKSTRRGGVSTTWNLRYGTDPTAAGTAVWTSNIVTSTSGAVQTNGSPNNPNIPADNFIWMDVTAADGPPTETLIIIRYTVDFV
jgi:hypothetical protein